jgi:predicted metal-dependent peptidase
MAKRTNKTNGAAGVATATPAASPSTTYSGATVLTGDDGERQKRIDGCCMTLYRYMPFWGFLTAGCKFMLSDVPTACVDRSGNIRLGREFMDKLTDKQLCFLISHEIGHVAFSHFDRRLNRDPMVWNMANDYAENLILIDQMGRDAWIEGGCLDEKFRDLTSEQVYEELMRGAKKVKVNLGGTGADMQDEKNPQGGEPCEGEAVARERGDEERKSEKDWDGAIARAAAYAKQQGELPEGLERMVSEKVDSKVAWGEKLRQFIRFGVSRDRRDDYSFSKPNRRNIWQDLYLPSAIGFNEPKIAFAVDTSGSIGEEEIAQAVAEIEAIRRDFGCSMYLIDCDAEVHSGRWLDAAEAVPTKFKGGGGTDFAPVFAHLEQNRVPVDVCIYITDGYGNFGEEPSMDVIWVMTTSEKPPFGECIQIGVPS